MAVISFASLKGGVGKTTLSLSIAHAFAERGCQTLLIDLDPAQHASRFFQPDSSHKRACSEAPLARLFLSAELEGKQEKVGGLIETAMASCIPIITPARPRFGVINSGSELRHFLWGKGARAFKALFPQLLDELNCSYDYIIIDTPPDFNVLSRNSIAVSDLVVVPVDSSAMSIHCLEELASVGSHIKGPNWSILRTMVNRQASRVQRLTAERLHENLNLRSSDGYSEEEDENYIEANFDDPEAFIAMLDQREGANGSRDIPEGENPPQAQSPIFLLNSVVYRTEQQNRLSFLGKTAFDNKATSRLAEQYLGVAREIEEILSYAAENESLAMMDEVNPAEVLGLHASAG